MTDLPISFTVELVRQLRGGGISQLRRPRGLFDRLVPGDRLWVREPFLLEERFDGMAPLQAAGSQIVYVASGTSSDGFGKQRFARVMPKALHRMHLRVIAVRHQQMHEMTDADARAEGAPTRAAFAARWDAVHCRNNRSMTGDAIRWADNPRMTVITFDRIDTPIPNSTPGAPR